MDPEAPDPSSANMVCSCALRAVHRSPFREWKFTEPCSDQFCKYQDEAGSGSELEDWLNQHGKLPHVIKKILWSLQNEILGGKWKFFTRKIPSTGTGWKQWILQQPGTAGLVVSAASSSTPELQESGGARSRAYKTQATSSTQLCMAWLSASFWQNFRKHWKTRENSHKENENGERPKKHHLRRKRLFK